LSKGLVFGIAFVGSTTGCLPVDTAPPAEVLVNLRASALSSEIPSSEMADGWQIEFERYLITIGSVSLSPGGVHECKDATTTRYSRVLTLRQSQPQKVGLVFGRGVCLLGYGIFPIGRTSPVVRGAGVSESDMELMLSDDISYMRRSGVTTESVSITTSAVSGTGLYVEGTATRGAEHKRFRWEFPYVTPADSAGCPLDEFTTVHLDAGAQVTVELTARGEALFAQDSLSEESLSFDSFAAADRDGDGFITTVELATSQVRTGTTLYDETLSALREKFSTVASGADCRRLDER